jgi:tetratricopeptide (TPR) repeat protein
MRRRSVHLTRQDASRGFGKWPEIRWPWGELFAPRPFRGFFARFLPVVSAALLLSSWFPVWAGPAQQYLDRAENALKKGQVIAARNFLVQARRVEPEASTATAFEKRLDEYVEKKVAEHLRAAEFYFEAKNVLDAEKEFEKILHLLPDHQKAKERLEEILVIKRTVAKFQEQGVKVSAATGRQFDVELYSAVSYLARAQAAFDKGDLDTARDLVLKVLARESDSKEAADLLQEITDLQAVRSNFATAQSSLEEGEFARAVLMLDRLLGRDPDRRDLLLMRAKAFLQLDRPAPARKDIDRAMALGAATSETFPLLVKALIQQKEYAKALAVAGHPHAGEETQSWGFFLKNWARGFPWSTFGFLFFGVAFFISAIWSLLKFDAFLARIRLKTFLKAVKTLFCAAMLSQQQSIDTWQELAEKTGHPWFHYVSSLLAIAGGLHEEAQEHLRVCLDHPGLGPRAFILLGVTRVQSGQILAEHDFEEGVAAALRGLAPVWRPRFLRELELSAFASIPASSSLAPVIGELVDFWDNAATNRS